MMRDESVRNAGGLGREEVIDALRWLRVYEERKAPNLYRTLLEASREKLESWFPEAEAEHKETNVLREEERRSGDSAANIGFLKKKPPQEGPLSFSWCFWPLHFFLKTCFCLVLFPFNLKNLSISCTEVCLMMYFLHFLLSENTSMSPLFGRRFAGCRSLG